MPKLKLPRRANGLRGPKPEPRMWAEVVIEKRPSDQWMADNLPLIDAGQDPKPTDEDMMVGCNVYAHMAFPDEVKHPRHWKQGRALVGTLVEVPYSQFLSEIEQNIAEQEREAAIARGVAEAKKEAAKAVAEKS